MRQPHREKSHATSLGKKSQNLLLQKKILQPFRTKKNHSTSWDKKSCNLLGPKNHATSGGKNHSTSQDKKIMFQIAPNGIKFVQMGPNSLEQVQMDPNWSNFIQKGLNGSKWDNLVLIGPNGFNECIGVKNWGPKQGSKTIMNSIGWPLLSTFLPNCLLVKWLPIRIINSTIKVSDHT